MIRYAIIVRTYLSGTTESVGVDSQEDLDKAIEALKQNTQSALTGFHIYMHKESFSRKQIWSSNND